MVIINSLVLRPSLLVKALQTSGWIMSSKPFTLRYLKEKIT